MRLRRWHGGGESGMSSYNPAVPFSGTGVRPPPLTLQSSRCPPPGPAVSVRHSGSSGHPPGAPSRPHFLSGARLRSRASQGTRGAGISGQLHITVCGPPPCKDLAHVPLQQGSVPAYPPGSAAYPPGDLGTPGRAGLPSPPPSRAPALTALLRI